MSVDLVWDDISKNYLTADAPKEVREIVAKMKTKRILGGEAVIKDSYGKNGSIRVEGLPKGVTLHLNGTVQLTVHDAIRLQSFIDQIVWEMRQDER